MPGKAESLSDQEARKMVLLSQRMPPPKQAGSALSASLSALEHLGYIQIDTISVIQRAHHHTLWNRNPRYLTSHLEKLVADKSVFEYWSHAAAYLPMMDFRYSLPRKEAIKKGVLNHWFERDNQLMKSVLKRIAAEGPLMARDFEYKGGKQGEWNSKPAKRALENLFMQGELMIAFRNNFQKVYDLTERVIPENTDCTIPDPREHARFLIKRYLGANGLGQASEISYLLKETKALVLTALQEMESNKEVIRIKVKDISYYALPFSLELLNKSLSRATVKILSPFDNLLIQRKRSLALFDFDYQLECYFPEKKRKYGYFVLPVYWDGSLQARMDCKTDRKNSVLHINSLILETGLSKEDAFTRALSQELISFLRFNDCEKLIIHRTNPSHIKPELERLMQP